MDTDDNYVSFGTALDPIEEEEVARKKPIMVSEQIATDEKGRRRFHGAFTGGFSAGYFNSVGSKEGWTPSTFKSSRADRFSSKDQKQNVTDFMDEEDIGAFGIAPQVLRPTDDFSISEAQNSSRKRSKAVQSDGPIPGVPVLHQIIEPVIETVGIKILIKMGWRQGQGVGPRVSKDKSRRKKKMSSKDEIDKPTIIEEMVENLEDAPVKKTYGCQLPPNIEKNIESSSDEEIDTNILYAPEDVDSPLCNPKENTFGLGYKGLERMSSSSGHIDLFGKQLKFQSKGKHDKNVTGEAFGIGAFEEPDEDVYAREDLSQYDFELETMEERKARKTKEALEKKKKKHTDSCIEGFRLAKSTSNRKKYFPPPHLPHNFEPIHIQRKSRFEEPLPKVDNSDKKAGRHALTVQERQVLLGETNSVPKSPENKLTTTISDIELKEPTIDSSLPIVAEQDPTVIERIERIKKFVQVLQVHSAATPDASAVSKPEFKPFISNPEKQDRYEKYLTLVSSGFQDCMKDLQPSSMTEWERQRENQEFERAAAIYKPLTGVMSSRFVSAKSHDISHVVPEKEVLKEKDATEDPKVAARLNLFGKLTHMVVEWHPDKLLCKRFNIKDPFPDSKFVGLRGGPSFKSEDIIPYVPPTTPAPKKSLFDNLDFSKPPPGLLPLNSSSGLSNSTEPPPPGESSLMLDFQSGASEEKENIPAKAPLDLFKEIFADSSESEDEEISSLIDQSNRKDSMKDNTKERDDFTRDKQISNNRNRTTVERSTNNSRNEKDIGLDSSKKGIFQNLDLTKLNHRGDNNQGKTTTSQNKSENIKVEINDESEDDQLYGPRVPNLVSSKPAINILKSHYSSSQPAVGSSSSSVVNITSSTIHDDEIVWVEKESVSNKRSKSKKHSIKKSKRNKSKKAKGKHKKSKKHTKSKKIKHSSKSQNSSESSSNEDRRKKDDNDSSDDSSSSIIIHSSLDQQALLAQLTNITRSH